MPDNDNKWADIDDAGYWHEPEAEEKQDGPAVTDDISQEKKEEPLVKLSSGAFIEPSMGFEFNKQCKVRIKVDYLDESARNMKKVNFSLFSKYLGKTENLNVSKDGYEQDGYAEADVTLYYPSAYDEEKDLNVKYFFRATHRRGDKAVDSMELNMPQPLHFVELKKDDYDENGADKYNKEKDGDNYREKQVVTELQKNLVTLGFLADSKYATDGYFGDTTDTAVREFQDYAIKTDRMKRSKGKIEQADKALDQSGPDGIVGKKTADEIDLWLRKDWVKPEITLRHGEYDDTGVQNGKGNKGTDDHHTGTPVVKAQENLQNAGVYKEYNVDGWFHDHMYESLKRFQDAAAEGKFLIDNVLTDIGEKLTGHVKGSYCPKTRAYLEKVVEKNGVVPEDSIQQYKFPLDIKYQDKEYKTGIRAFGSSRDDGKRAHAGCDLYAPAGEKIYAVADGEIKAYHDFYMQTYVVVVDHKDFIIRYGEVQPPNDHDYGDNPSNELRKGLAHGVFVGCKIRKGQHIAYVGQLRQKNKETGIFEKYKKTMLHLEMYKGTVNGDIALLTVRGNVEYDFVSIKKYERRKDLLDPTEFLEKIDS
jgi:peptidoglycan hydrolase-like protein with peptidoglycan-binding domain